MHHLRYIEAYITNVCNLNCDNCRTYNNYSFTGHQRWDDYKDLYADWGKRLVIDRIGLLGGEPMLNPTFIDWIEGFISIWPKVEIVINTNGTQFNRWPNLYTLSKKYAGQISFVVNRHNINEFETSKDTVRKSVDKSKTFVKWNGPIPESVLNLQTKEGPYTYEEMLGILAGPEWTDPNPITQ